MNGATAKALRPTQARSVQRILRGLGALWEAPALADIGVVANPRLSRTLGRLVGRQHRIELGPRALGSSKRLREVVTHEGAHAALATRRGAAPQRASWARMATPHGASRLSRREGRSLAVSHTRPGEHSARTATESRRPTGNAIRPLVSRLPVQPSRQTAREGLALRRLRGSRPGRNARDHPKNGKPGHSPMTTPAECPFCFPTDDRIAFEDRLTRALWDAFPVSPGHLLLVPRRHVPTWFDATAEERAALMAGVDRGRELIASRHAPTASTSASTSAKPPARRSSTSTST